MSLIYTGLIRWLSIIILTSMVLTVAVPVIAVDTTFLIDEQQSILTIDASTVFIIPFSDSDTQSLGGTIDASFDFGMTGDFPSLAEMTINGSEISPLAPFLLTLGSPPSFGVNVSVTGTVANTTTIDPPSVLTRLPGSDIVYEFDAADFEVTLNQGVVNISGAVSETIDLAESPVSGIAPVGSMGKLSLTPGATVGGLTSVEAVMELPILFTQIIDLDGQVITLDVDGVIISTSSFEVALAGFAADFNSDTIVDAADLVIWESAFGSTPQADADGDGVSDGADFLIWQQEFGSGASALAVAEVVPEPGSWCLVLTTILGAVGRRRAADLVAQDRNRRA